MKILVVGPSWVGDAVISQSLFKIILSKSEDIEIHVLSNKWTFDIFERMDETSETILLPFDHGELKLIERAQLGNILGSKNYDQAIVLQNSFKSSLVPFFAGIPLRTGWRGEMRYLLLNDIRKLNKDTYPRMVDRFVALGLKEFEDLPSDIPYPNLAGNEANINQLSSVHGIDLNKPLISLCPGAEFGPSKRWPSKYYAEIANEYLSRDWQILLLGSENDVSIGQEIEEYSEKSHKILNLIGKTKLFDTVDILKASKLVLCNDSGLMHIAASVDVPLVALYGPTSPEFTPPLSNKAKVIKKSEGFTKVRRGDLEDGYHQSLIDIKPKEVLETLLEFKF